MNMPVLRSWAGRRAGGALAERWRSVGGALAERWRGVGRALVAIVGRSAYYYTATAFGHYTLTVEETLAVQVFGTHQQRLALIESGGIVRGQHLPPAIVVAARVQVCPRVARGSAQTRIVTPGS